MVPKPNYKEYIVAIVRRFATRFPIFTYFLLTFLISWGGIFMVMGPGGVSGSREISAALMPLVYLATLLGPGVAGLAMTGFADSRAGFRNLWLRMLRWRVHVRWYGIALLTAPLLISATLLLLSGTSPAYLPAIVTSDAPISLLLTGVVMGLVVGFFEELGWTGFAIPKLRQQYGVLTTGLLLGCFWGLWHLPLFLGSITSSGTVPPVLYLMVLLFSFLPAYRVLMVWVYEHTGSLLTMILMHAPLSASQLVLIPPEITSIQIVTYNLIFTALLWMLIAVVGVIRHRLTRGIAGLRE